MFIGRENELKKILNAFSSDKLEVIVLYGRRRVGKTELIKEALSKTNLKSSYYVCNSLGEKRDLMNFQTVLGDTFKGESFVYDSFINTFRALFEKSKTTSFILALDEFPNLEDDVKGVAESLQNLIDEYKNDKDCKIKIIISGSFLKSMNNLIGPDGALFKRDTLKLLLRPMDYYDASKFFTKMNSKDKAMFYSVFGGLPYCLELASRYGNLKDALINLIISEGMPLNDFESFVARKELIKLNGASEVFLSIAGGENTFNKILNSTSIKEATTLNRILTTMLEMDLIEKVVPINDKTNKKKTFYVIKDNYLLFYYTYIEPHRSSLIMMYPDDFYKLYIEPTLEKVFCAKIFEKITKEYLIRQNRDKKLDQMYEDVGTYWYDDFKNKRNGQFDVALKCEDNYFLVECKFTNNKIDDDVIKEEEIQTKSLELKNIKLGFASLNGFKLGKDYRNKYYYVSLDNMYKL